MTSPPGDGSSWARAGGLASYRAWTRIFAITVRAARPIPDPRAPPAPGSVRSRGQAPGSVRFRGRGLPAGCRLILRSRRFGSGRAGVADTGATFRSQAIFFVGAFLDLPRHFLDLPRHSSSRVLSMSVVRLVRDSRIAAQCFAQRRRGPGRTAVDTRRRRDKAGDGLIGPEFDRGDADHRDNECGSTGRPDLDPGLGGELPSRTVGSRFVCLGRSAGGQHVAVVSGQSAPASLGDFPQCHGGGRIECSGIESGAHCGNDQSRVRRR